jgi:hypothetical protein
MLAQAYHPLQFFEQQLYPSSPKIHADDLPHGHRLQIGHQDLGLFRPIVTPACTEEERDVSEMAPPRSLGIDPKGSTALTIDGGIGMRICVYHQRGRWVPSALSALPLVNFQIRGSTMT